MGRSIWLYLETLHEVAVLSLDDEPNLRTFVYRILYHYPANETTLKLLCCLLFGPRYSRKIGHISRQCLDQGLSLKPSFATAGNAGQCRCTCPAKVTSERSMPQISPAILV